MDTLVAAQIALAACQDVLFAVVAGVLACAVLLPRSGAALVWPTAALRATLRGWQLSAGIALVLACCLYLWLQAAVMSGSPFTAAATALWPVLTQSHYGGAWVVGCAGAACLVVAVAVSRRSDTRAVWLASAIGALLYVAGKAGASHAADDGDFTVREAVHVVHLGATAVWAGSVIIAPAVLRWLHRHQTAPQPGIRFRMRLSGLATVALLVVVASGIYNASRDTAAATVPLLSTAYGQILVVKLALVAFAVMLGGWNRMSYLPQMRGQLDVPGAEMTLAHTARRFDRLLTIEACAMLAILIAAGLLGHTAPIAG